MMSLRNNLINVGGGPKPPPTFAALEASQVDFAYAHGITAVARLIIRDPNLHKPSGCGCLQVKKPLRPSLVCRRGSFMKTVSGPITIFAGFAGQYFVPIDISGLRWHYLYLINRSGLL